MFRDTRLLWQLPILALLLGNLASAEDASTKPAPPGPETIKKLIARLGSEEYREREESTRKLMNLEEALPALEEALNSADTEVRRRAMLILGVLRPKVADKAFREFLPEAREERLRGLIERLAAAKGSPTEAQWQEVFQRVRELAGRTGRIRGKEGYFPDIDPTRLRFSTGSAEKVWFQRKVVVAGLDHDLSMLDRCVLVSTASTRYIGRIYNSIVLVNGDIQGSTAITNSVVFCRGKLGASVGVYRSIILATNRFEGCTNAEDSLFQVAEVGHCSDSRNNFYITKGDVKTSWAENDRYFPERPAPAVPPVNR